jgi:hypothetical protein
LSLETKYLTVGNSPLGVNLVFLDGLTVFDAMRIMKHQEVQLSNKNDSIMTAL